MKLTHMTVPQHVTASFHTMQKVEAGQLALSEAALSLGRSYRQTLRSWKQYRQCAGSFEAFCRPSKRGGWNKKEPALIQAIIDCKTTHPHRSVFHVRDVINEECGAVSPSTVWRILHDADLLGKADERESRVFKRYEASSFGERLQMDTTSGAWMTGYRLIYLIAIIDDHSRMLLGWKWVDSDSAWNNMQVLRSVYEKYGLPQTLYTDNASMFKTIRHNRSIYQTHAQEGYETEIQRCMRELGITMFSHKPYEPQSKGKVERFFRFVQERFVREHTAKNLLELNEQFEPWARWYNTKHVNRTTKQKPKDRSTPSVFAPVPARRRLDSAFSFKLTRKLDKCNAFSLEGESYRLPEAKPLMGRRVDLETTPFEIRVYYQGTLIERINRENPR